MRDLTTAIVLIFASASSALASPTPEVAIAHPPVDAFYSCSEHFAGQFSSLGDALGTDCTPQRLTEVDGRLWSRAYANDGASNEDWYGWSMELLSPCDCEVVEVFENNVQNTPGVMGKGRAASVDFKRSDGVHFTYAHVRNVLVSVGDKVVSGQPVAMIGNNGYSRSPHVHVAAWHGKTPLQIRWDQTKMKLPPEFREQE